MTKRGSSHFGAAIVAGAVLVAAPVGAGCDRSKEARGDTMDPPTNAAAARASDKFSEAAFELVLRPVGEYRAGQVGRVDAVLGARDPYHVNAEYPLKFTARTSTGIKYAREVVGKDAAKFEVKRATVPVEFTPETAGRKVVAGTLRFSVCNDQRCLIEKRELEVGIDVK
jgi:hypothetical protein